MQDRYGNGTIGKGSKECYSPVCAISTAKCYLVALYYTRVHHTPGTAFLNSEKKFSTSGEYYQHEVTYTTPGMIAEDYNQKLSKAGAMVLTAKGGRKIVIHKNDLYQNVQLKINTNISPDKTQIKLSTNSINPL
jgi:hypothetical protein